MRSVAEEKRSCAFCGRELLGRSDKKFCDDACRNNYAYQHNKYDNDLVNKVNKSLLYNRNVLKSITCGKRKIVKRQTLIDNNFNFDVITGVYRTHKQHEYRLLYDYAYKCVNDEDVLVLKCC